jgi:hypothetical protein
MLSESKFSELLARQQECGLNITAFCLNEGLPKATFYYWKKKLQLKQSTKGFIPLLIKPERTSIRQRHCRALPDTSPNGIPQDGANDYFLEVVYLNGTKLRIKGDLDLTRLRELVYLID